MKNLFIIGWGLSGGFGGETNFQVVEANDQEDAETQAYWKCCEEYENYAGMYGLRTEDMIMEEDGCDESQAESTYKEEREDWLEYSAVPWSKEAENKAEGHHYHNPYR